MSPIARAKKLLSNKGLAGFLARGFLGSGGLKVAQALIGLAMVTVMARALGPEGYGIYAFAFSIASLLAIPAQMGMPVLMVREVARFQLKQEWGLFRGLLQRSNQLVAINSLILLAGAAVYFFLWPDKAASEQGQTLLWALALVPLIALGNLRGATLRGLRKVVQGQLPEMLLRPLFLLLLMLAAWLLWGDVKPSQAMLLHGMASLLAFLLGLLMLMKSLPAAVQSTPAEYQTRAWLGSLLPLAFIAGMQIINNQADIVMLGMMASKAEVGIYRVAVQGASLVAFALTAVNIVIAPQITRLYHQQDQKRLQRMVTLSARLIMAAAMPIALLLIFFGQPLLRWIFGVEFADGHLALAILCIGQLVNASMGSVGFLLNMTGHENETAKGVMIAAVSNILLNLLLIPRFSMEGAAAATAISLSVWNILLYRKVWQHLGVDSMAFSIRRKGINKP